MKRNDIHRILIIGSGPIIIGQACEFDYSGTQACKALRKLGYEIILVNSNPATIMTDPETADVTYIEPLNVARLTEIIEKERPDALLPNLGGQSGLNLCSELAQAGVLDKYNVQVIGVQVDAIERGEDRIEFKNTMDELGIEMARSQVAYSVEEAVEIADRLGYPVVLRPAYTMGGAGGGLVYNVDELRTVCARGLQASLVHQVLVEESVIGWEELELEVVRDSKGQMITVCFIENIDPMGVHTGDSYCAAPMLTISQEVQDRLQEQAYKIVDKVQVIGGCNCQFAHDPKSDRIIVGKKIFCSRPGEAGRIATVTIPVIPHIKNLCLFIIRIVIRICLLYQLLGQSIGFSFIGELDRVLFPFPGHGQLVIIKAT